MFPGLRSPSRRPVADYRFVFGHCHVRAVALEGEAAFHISLRFVLRFRAGGRDGRGSRTSTFPVAARVWDDEVEDEEEEGGEAKKRKKER